MKRVGPLAIVIVSAACGAGTPPPKTDADPLDPLGRANGTAAVASDDAGTRPAAAPADDAGADPQAGLTALAKGQGAPSGLAVDETSVYFANELEGAVMRVGKSGGTVEIAYTAPAPFGAKAFLTVDDKSIYVAGGGSVVKIDKDTGRQATTLASAIKEPFRAIAFDAASVYWVAGDNVLKVAKAGGAPAAVAAVQRDVTSVGVDAKNVFWSTAGDGMIWRAAARGADVVVRGADKPGCLAFDDTSVYFCAGAKVMKAPKAGGAATAVATADGTVILVALDGTNAYYATANGSVGRAPKAGSGAGETLVTGQTAIAALVVDASAFYFSTRGTDAKKLRDGAVYKRLK